MAALSTNVFAVEHRAHNVSIGFSNTFADVSGDNIDVHGIGLNYHHIAENSEWGFGGTVEYTKQDDSTPTEYVEDTVVSVAVGPIFQPSDAKWFRVYPTIGYTSYKLKADTVNLVTDSKYHGFNLGMGAQITIPRTWLYADVNAKYHKITNDLFDDSNIWSLYFGLGYRF